MEQADKDKLESIPPIAQKIIMGIVNFMINKFAWLLSIISLMILVDILFAPGPVSIYSWVFFLLILSALVLYNFYFRKKILNDLKLNMQNIRFDTAEYKTINIGGLKYKEQDNSLKK